MALDFAPSCDVKEADNHYVLSFDLPGVKKEDIKISLQDNSLTVSGERKEEKEEKDKGRTRSERFYGTFRRTFTLPPGVKPEMIESEYKDGVLRLAFPKTESAQSHNIKIGESKPGFWERLLSHKKDEMKKSIEKVA